MTGHDDQVELSIPGDRREVAEDPLDIRYLLLRSPPLISAILRPGTVHASRFVVLVLRAHWPGVPIELRAGSGLAIPRVYRFCEEHAITYTIGLATNARLKPLAQDLRAAAITQQKATFALAALGLLHETLSIGTH